MMRILHITPWFPETNDPHHGVFIARHIASLQRDALEQSVIHIAIHFPGEKHPSYTEGHIMHIHQTLPVRSWRLAEWTFALILRKKLMQIRAKENFSHVCFHIAYPALAQYKVFEHVLPDKKLIIEHWSAYHFNFHTDKKNHRLSRLFQQGIQLATVSKRLGNDIISFCGSEIPFAVLPNVVDTNIFCIRPEENTAHQNGNEIKLMMHAFWKAPKKPLEIFEEIRAQKTSNVKLLVTGSGPMWESMKNFVATNNLTKKIQFVDSAPATAVASFMREADVFLMPTDYETFSVVTAEALCCGCPVVASHAGALPELIHDGNGMLKTNSSTWLETIEQLIQKNLNRPEIAQDASFKYSKRIVGDQFFSILQSM
jgi:L-malate glycosyltransferase